MFPQSRMREDIILQERLNENARDDQVFNATCTKEYEIRKECPNENDREDQGLDAVSRDWYEIQNQRIAGAARENEPCNA